MIHRHHNTAEQSTVHIRNYQDKSCRIPH